jgi:hypothetical protein
MGRHLVGINPSPAPCRPRVGRGDRRPADSGSSGSGDAPRSGPTRRPGPRPPLRARIDVTMPVRQIGARATIPGTDAAPITMMMRNDSASMILDNSALVRRRPRSEAAGINVMPPTIHPQSWARVHSHDDDRDVGMRANDFREVRPSLQVSKDSDGVRKTEEEPVRNLNSAFSRAIELTSPNESAMPLPGTRDHQNSDSIMHGFSNAAAIVSVTQARSRRPAAEKGSGTIL